jgi:SAM-dependent methyltransferase
MTSARASAAHKAIKGWFNEIDRRVFTALLESQRDSPPGDLVELGAFHGKSAVIIGDYLREGERFVIVDLFGDDEQLDSTQEGEANRRENLHSYPGLTRQRFEENYLSAHDELPVVVQGLSSTVVDHVQPGGARFIHVDASHLYPAVRTDCLSAKQLLRPGGVLAFDDYRNEKTPGVAAAVWESVANDGMIPIATTERKLYACFDDPTPHQETLRALIAENPAFYKVEEPEIRGRRVLRMLKKPRPKPVGDPAA